MSLKTKSLIPARKITKLRQLRKAIGDLRVSDEGTRGAFYTRKEVVRFILDLLDYRVENDLSSLRLLDPCFGEGAFLLEAVDRLLVSAKFHKKLKVSILKESIKGVEVANKSFGETKAKVIALLLAHSFSKKDATLLVTSWLSQGDFLLADLKSNFDLVIGNPPYIRLENINKVLLTEYRRRFQTLGNRADLYIAFFEKGMNLLKEGGALSYICADRWLKNAYGKGLRDKMHNGFHLEYVLNLHNADPFESKVDAYPSVFLIRKNNHKTTIYRELTHISEKAFNTEFKATRALIEANKTRVVKHTISFEQSESLFGSDILHPLLHSLAQTLPTIEEAGVKLGIGVATGCDQLFILEEKDKHRVEKDRLLKFALREDVFGEEITWSGKYLINTFDDKGVISLDAYPKLKKYFLEGEDILRKRHVSQEKPKHWFRTIDRPIVSLLNKPRLYIPDIMLSPKIVYTTSDYYPHHNLYWMTSETWNLKALKTILKSVISFLYVDTYSTRVRGGYYRYQAQTLRKIRLPNWSDIAKSDQKQLISLSDSTNFKQIDDIVCRIYNLSDAEKGLLFNIDDQHGIRFSKLREANTQSS